MLEDANSNEQGKKQRQRYCPGVQAERKSAFLVFGGKISRLDSQGSILLSNKSFQLAWDTACLSASVGNSSCALSTRAQTRGQSAVVFPTSLLVPPLPYPSATQRSLTLWPACSPSCLCDPLHQRLQQSRCLHCCPDCYRVEGTGSRAGILPLWTSAFHCTQEMRATCLNLLMSRRSYHGSPLHPSPISI